jgi:radical SAM superfamily enzyme YgiQ (UPF0313 family)
MSYIKVVDVIEHLRETFGVQYIRFFDDTWNWDRKRAEKICEEIIRRKIDVIWRCESRIDTVNRQLLKKMSKAGCHLIEYGVESGSQRIVEIIGKKIDLSRVKKTIELTRRYGMEAKGFFIVGLPTETIKDFLSTLKIMHLFDSVGIYPLTIFPGSRIYYRLKKKGVLHDDLFFTKRRDIFFTKQFGGNFTEKQLIALFFFASLSHRITNPHSYINQHGSKIFRHLLDLPKEGINFIQGEAYSLP